MTIRARANGEFGDAITTNSSRDGFDSQASAENYLKSALFSEDVVRDLKPYLAGEPEIRVYERQ